MQRELPPSNAFKSFSRPSSFSRVRFRKGKMAEAEASRETVTHARVARFAGAVDLGDQS